MTINKREKNTYVDVENFIGGAEKDRSWNSTNSLKDRITSRGSGRKYTLTTLVGTEKQHDLLKYAAKKLGISQSEVIRRYLFESLEKDFGESLPASGN